jgi:hypothetical protein
MWLHVSQSTIVQCASTAVAAVRHYNDSQHAHWQHVDLLLQLTVSLQLLLSLMLITGLP